MAIQRFGTRVRLLREKANMPLRALARQMEWSPSYLSDIELNQRRPPAPEKIRMIAEILTANVEELIALAEQEKKEVRLSVDPDDQPLRRKVGLCLARHWDDLPKETLEAIDKILEG